jgi:hypothetical protein
MSYAEQCAAVEDTIKIIKEHRILESALQDIAHALVTQNEPCFKVDECFQIVNTALNKLKENDTINE